jgi:hypothetical protein
MNTAHNPTTEDMPEFTEADRAAMRAYLQRTEVRLSTLHRIATAFIGGAGLLLLVPIFLRDAVDAILLILLEAVVHQFINGGSDWRTVMIQLLLLYPFLLSLALPLYGVYLLLKDIVHFYFTLYTPGFPHSLLNPTFALTGVSFSPDESPRVKQAVMRYQYAENNMDFMIPFSHGRRELYFDRLAEATHNEIMPQTRQSERLHAEGLLPDDADEQTIRRFNTAFGIARSLDRTLAEEVALTEMALVRNIMYLRRVMLRYVKTLLIFIWTTVLAFLMLPFLESGRFPVTIVLGIGYGVWSMGAMHVISLPIQWIYRHLKGDFTPQIDTQLTLMEQGVKPFVVASIVTSLAGLLLAVLS